MVSVGGGGVGTPLSPDCQTNNSKQKKKKYNPVSQKKNPPPLGLSYPYWDYPDKDPKSGVWNVEPCVKAGKGFFFSSQKTSWES